MMMDVREMRRIVDVVTTGAIPEPAQEAAARWRGDSIVHVRSSINHIFRFRLPDKRIGYLRLTPVAQRSQGALASEIVFIEQAATTGIVVACPVRSAADVAIEAIGDAAHGYHAVVFEELTGQQLTLEGIGEMRFRAWGRTLARLHQVSQTLPVQPARPSWESEVHDARASLPAEETTAADILDATLAWLRTRPGHSEEYGLIHGDAELDNLIWDGARPQLLDFDSCIYAPYALDIAIALQDVWRAGGAERDTRVAWFSEGYSEIRPLPPTLREDMPQMQRALIAFKIACLLRAYAHDRLDSPTDPSDPLWLATMRTRHHKWLANQRAALKQA